MQPFLKHIHFFPSYAIFHIFQSNFTIHKPISTITTLCMKNLLQFVIYIKKAQTIFRLVLEQTILYDSEAWNVKTVEGGYVEENWDPFHKAFFLMINDKNQ